MPSVVLHQEVHCMFTFARNHGGCYSRWRFLAWFAAHQEIAHVACKSPSWTRHWTVWSTHWKKTLRFWKRSQPAQCEICWRISHFLHACAPGEGPGLVQQGQYADRKVYWMMRFMSRLRTHNCVVIIDSLDKIKGSWSRYRPKLVITAAIMPGFGCWFYLLDDETMHKGASMFAEVLSSTVEHIIRICKERHWRVPDQLCLQVDNTPAWAKNSPSVVCLAYLVAHPLFSAVMINLLLLVRHTHEDVDRLFAFLIANVLLRKSCHCPTDLLENIVARMTKYVSPCNEV